MKTTHLVFIINTHAEVGGTGGAVSVFEALSSDGALALGFLFYVCVCLNLLILSHWAFLCLVSKVLSHWAEPLSIGPQVFRPSASMKSRLWNPLSELPWPLGSSLCHVFKVNRGLAELPSLQWEAKWPLLDFTVLALFLKREEKKPRELKTRAWGKGGTRG